MSAPHPDVTRVVQQFAAAGVPTYDTVGVLHARALLEGVSRVQGPKVEVAQVRDVLLPGAVGRLPARVYDPDPTRPLPVVLYLHGGGWTLGGIKPADGPCRALAAASGCVVVSLAYRLAPETPFPGPLEDCVAAARALAADPAAVGGDSGGLVVVGDSAGGNLAAVTSLVLRGSELVRAQVLLYPCLSPARDSPFASYTENADGPLMTRAEMLWFWEHYLGPNGDPADPRAAPLAAPDHAGLPPTTVVVCELDPLRDEGLEYARVLDEAGVTVRSVTVPGAAHGFWWMDAVMTQAGELTEQLGTWIRGYTA